MASREATQSTEVVKSCLVLVISMSVFHSKLMIFKLMIRKVRRQAGRQAGKEGKQRSVGCQGFRRGWRGWGGGGVEGVGEGAGGWVG